jgi:hypothetical protein
MHNLLEESLARALKISGWMSETELYWLATQAKKHQTIVEIGSFLGRSTRALAENTQGKVLAIDDWKGVRMTAWGDTVPVPDDCYGTFCKNLADLIPSKVIPVVTDHAHIPFDVHANMTFIDGDHLYESVKRDILFWRGRTDFLCGHDSEWPGVQQALEELCPNYCRVAETSIWYDQ